MGLAFKIVYSVKDEKNAVSDLTVQLPSAVTHSNALAFALTLAPLIDALISGQIYRFGIMADYTFASGVKTAPEDGSDVEEGAKFQFLTEGGNFTSLRLPTFREEFIMADSALVDTADADVLAFVTAMVDGIDLAGALPLVEPSDGRDEDITELLVAKEAFTSSRRS